MKIPHQNVTTQEGRDKLREKAKYYGYYAKNLQVEELIYRIEQLLECWHVGCACVCGHTGKCPEDGPSLTSNNH